MKDETLSMPIDLPRTDEGKKAKPRVNCLQEMVIEFMNEFELKDVDMVKGTGISWSTWHGWITGDVNSQLADKNLLRLWQFVNTYKPMPLQYLLYGIGDTYEAFEKFLDEEKDKGAESEKS